MTRILTIARNLPVPFARRVWLECQAPASAGYQVAVTCPAGEGDSSYAVVDGVQFYKYRPYAQGRGKVDCAKEYLHSFLATAWLTAAVLRLIASADVTVVRTGAGPERLVPGEPKPELRRGRQCLAAYIGVMAARRPGQWPDGTVQPVRGSVPVLCPDTHLAEISDSGYAGDHSGGR